MKSSRKKGHTLIVTLASTITNCMTVTGKPRGTGACNETADYIRDLEEIANG